jgi:hypothetical protein
LSRRAASQGTRRGRLRFVDKPNEGIETMLKLPPTLPVRTRVPLAAWAVAALVTLFSLASSLLQAMDPFGHAFPRAERLDRPSVSSHQAKV